MPSSKDRLYVALYARGGQGYHWALITGPKSDGPNDMGNKYHAKQYLQVWEFDEQDIQLGATNMILARVLVAKVQDKTRLKAILRSIPVRPEQPGWTCKSWVKEAFETLKAGQAIDCSTDWESIRQTAERYVQQKVAQHRYDGQAPPGQFDQERVPTWSLVDSAEINP